MITREFLTDAVRKTLAALPDVQAAWEGGSASFGRADEYSDLDVVALADPSKVEGIFQAVDEMLSAISPIALRLVIPPAQAYFGPQRFYRLRDASEHLLVDFVMLTDLMKARSLIDPVLHGRALMWFDRTAGLTPLPVDEQEFSRGLKDRFFFVKTRFEIFQTLIKREVARGRPLDALSFFFSMALGPLVEMLRMAHCPRRHTFGLRYTQYDLPPEVYARLSQLAFVKDLQAIEAQQQEMDRWFHEVATQLEIQFVSRPVSSI